MAKLLQGELFENSWSPIRTECSKKETYEDFVAKFDDTEAKTTDDCYTPQEVYNAVLNWVCERCDIAQRPIIRPFYPGGDYINEKYPVNCVVVDNPPFSILSRIVRFFFSARNRLLSLCPRAHTFLHCSKGRRQLHCH